MIMSQIKETTAKEFIWNGTPNHPIFAIYKNGAIVSHSNREGYSFIKIYNFPLTPQEILHGTGCVNDHITLVCAPDYHSFQIYYDKNDKITKILEKYAYHVHAHKLYHFYEGDEEKLIEELINLIR